MRHDVGDPALAGRAFLDVLAALFLHLVTRREHAAEDEQDEEGEERIPREDDDDGTEHGRDRAGAERERVRSHRQSCEQHGGGQTDGRRDQREHQDPSAGAEGDGLNAFAVAGGNDLQPRASTR